MYQKFTDIYSSKMSIIIKKINIIKYKIEGRRLSKGNIQQALLDPSLEPNCLRISITEFIAS